MADSALHQLYADSDQPHIGGGGGGAGSVVSAPVAAIGSLGAASQHLTLLGVLLLLLLAWGLVRKAGFHFVVSTGVGR